MIAVLEDPSVSAVVFDLDRPGAVDPPADGTSYHQFQVHQTTGMVTVQAGVDLDQALLMLRARAFSSRRPLLDVARDIVERRLRLTQED